MALNPNGDKETVSLVLLKRQTKQMRERQEALKRRGYNASFADVGREVVEAGLRVLFFAADDRLSADRQTDNPDEGAVA